MSILISLLSLAVIVLVPCIPAFLLFKALPCRADVSGPLQGLEVKLGGAFAGYFALVVLVLASHSVWQPSLRSQVWTVDGQLAYQGGQAQGLVNNTQIEPERPDVMLSSDGSFKMAVHTSLDPGGEVEFPKVDINLQGYSPVDIPLNNETWTNPVTKQAIKLKRDTVEHEIHIQQPIRLVKMSQYDAASGQTPIQEPN